MAAPEGSAGGQLRCWDARRPLVAGDSGLPPLLSHGGIDGRGFSWLDHRADEKVEKASFGFVEPVCRRVVTRAIEACLDDGCWQRLTGQQKEQNCADRLCAPWSRGLIAWTSSGALVSGRPKRKGCDRGPRRGVLESLSAADQRPMMCSVSSRSTINEWML
jgi:hypothetical protein